MALHPLEPIEQLDSDRELLAESETRNTVSLSGQQALVRTGWIFKLESVVIPAFLDSIAGAGWLRGLLPVINRIGQSGPAFLLAGRIKRTSQKRWVLLISSLGMAVPFLSIGAGLRFVEPGPSAWKSAAFLALYFAFFVFVGLNVLAYGTLQGKLVPAARRGRLLTLGTLGGSIPAVLLAWWLLPGWLAEGDAGWSKIFLFAGACFVLSGTTAFAIREPRDADSELSDERSHTFGGALAVLRDDLQFRRLVFVIVLLTSSLILIPHYQSLARSRFGLGGGDLMLWVIAQTAAIGLGSVLIGPIADRYGNRRALRLMIGVIALAPTSALALCRLPGQVGASLYVIVFVLLGATPLAIRLGMNYVLELAPETEHPRYLSIVQLCTAAFMFSSPFLGLLVDVAGYEAVFLGVTSLIVLGGWLAGGLADPRASDAKARARS